MPHTLTQSIDRTHYITDMVPTNNKHTVTATQISIRAARPVLGQPPHIRKSIRDIAIHGKGKPNTHYTPTIHNFGPAFPTLTQIPQGMGIPPQQLTSTPDQPQPNLEHTPLHRHTTIKEVNMQIVRPISRELSPITKGIGNNMIHGKKHLKPTKPPILYNIGSPSHTQALT